VKTRTQLWLLMGVVLLWVSGCMDFSEAQEKFCLRDPMRCGSAALPSDSPLAITESSQSSTQVMASDVVFFNVTAQDAETHELTFTWEASTGTLEPPSNTGTSSSVRWRAPLCVPAGSPVTITVTISDDGAHSISKLFTLTANPCPIPTVAGGVSHSLALRSDGTVWAWGDNSKGQLGDGTVTSRPTPVQVTALTAVTAVASGASHSLALRSDGTVWAWGDNSKGQFGDGTTTFSSTPVQVTGVTGITALAAGRSHSLALCNDGTVWAWGDNLEGQLGDATNTVRLTPVQVTGLTGITAINRSRDGHRKSRHSNSPLPADHRNPPDSHGGNPCTPLENNCRRRSGRTPSRGAYPLSRSPGPPPPPARGSWSAPRARPVLALIRRQPLRMT
jgi:Regulator of chromosome condensation (RCC1) repeat